MDGMDIDLDFDDPSAVQADIDIDGVDLDFDAPPQLEADAAADAIVTTQEAVPSADTIFTKVHIRGLDDLTTEVIKAYSNSHFPDYLPLVEWIDDTSANLVFETAEIASTALQALSLSSATETDAIDTFSLSPLQLRTAKTLEGHPNVMLQVRLAVATDKKRSRAHEASRFYMMHPEHDPREKRREQRGGASYNRRRYGGATLRRRRSSAGEGQTGFTASMYDDGPERRRSRRPGRRGSGTSYEDDNDDSGRDRDWDRSYGRRLSRSRSASPGARLYRRDRRDYRRNGARSRSPPPSYSARDPFPVATQENMGKELFPNRLATHNANNKTAAANKKRELFPAKMGPGMRNRTSLLSGDMTDSTADLFSKKMTVPLVDGSADDADGEDEDERFPLRSDKLQSQERNIKATPQAGTSKEDDTRDSGRGISIKGTATAKDKGISIRGTAVAAAAAAAAATAGDQGFAIRGLATISKEEADAKVRELFPHKVSNAGKELFGSKSRPSRARNRADMFY